MSEERSDPGVGPFAELLGARRAHTGEGSCRFELTAESRHLNPYGVVHGGVVYSLVDYAMGGALTSRLAPGERCATLEIKINYFRPVHLGRMTALARVLNISRNTAYAEGEIRNSEGKMLAKASGTFFVTATLKQSERERV